MRYRLTNLKYRIKYALQRLTHGYDDNQIYNLDTWLTRELGRRMLVLAACADSYPPHMTYEEWVDLLRIHGKALSEYDDFTDTSLPAQEALLFCAEYLPTLWD